ncbi:Uncharacterised protein [Rothia kristinae]|nr:Uncharacterised protein [Rothia kristinae]
MLHSRICVFGGSSMVRASGVYVPAMIREMFEWSRRLKTIRVRSGQYARWYIPETPNRITLVSANTAQARDSAPPPASTISTIPAAKATGAKDAWIHPRQAGLRSRTSAKRSAAVTAASSARSVARRVAASARSSRLAASASRCGWPDWFPCCVRDGAMTAAPSCRCGMLWSF